jgi:hypothetical protein
MQIDGDKILRRTVPNSNSHFWNDSFKANIGIVFTTGNKAFLKNWKGLLTSVLNASGGTAVGGNINGSWDDNDIPGFKMLVNWRTAD